MTATRGWTVGMIAASLVFAACTGPEEVGAAADADGDVATTEAPPEAAATPPDQPATGASATPASLVTLPPGREPHLLVDRAGLATVVHGQQDTEQSQAGVMDVVITRCLTADCDETVTNIVASGASTQSLHTAQLPNGSPVIAFVDTAAADVCERQREEPEGGGPELCSNGVLLVCDSPECTEPIRRTVDVASGLTLDVAVSPQGAPVLAYLRGRPFETARLGLLICGDATCEGSTEAVMDALSTGGFGTSTAIGFDEANAPFLVYEASRGPATGTAQGVFVSSCPDPTCRDGGRVVLVAEGAGLVAVDATATAPQFLVFDHFDTELGLIRCGDVSCADPAVSRVQVEQNGSSPAATLLSGPDGMPVILAGPTEGGLWDTADLSVLACGDAACSETSTSAISDAHVAQADAVSLRDGSLVAAFPRGATDGEGFGGAPIMLATCPQATCPEERPEDVVEVAQESECSEERPVADPPALIIEAYIDGTSRLLLRGDSAHWHHLEWAPPGLHEGNEPTRIGGIDCFPTWPEEGAWGCGGCDSRPMIGFRPAIPAGDVAIELVIVDGRGEVVIVEQPTPSNDHTVVLEFVDEDGGADWYTVELRW